MRLVNRPTALILLLLASLLAYSQAGTALAHESAAASIVVGDSIEAGHGASSPEKEYVRLFHEYLEGAFFRAEADLHNQAVPGATVREIFQTQRSPAIAGIQSHNPVVVIWGGGGNDLLDFIASPQAATCARGNASCLRRLNALLNEMEQTIDLTVKELRDTGRRSSRYFSCSPWIQRPSLQTTASTRATRATA